MSFIGHDLPDVHAQPLLQWCLQANSERCARDWEVYSSPCLWGKQLFKQWVLLLLSSANVICDGSMMQTQLLVAFLANLPMLTCVRLVIGQVVWYIIQQRGAQVHC
ncbi:hypothetical protein BKA82DRAFT_4015236 [Pisolithus tinctorius]|nr:hypothetical protein BKA82DRAFT_4015236 [Pisolithus tinctorius]